MPAEAAAAPGGATPELALAQRQAAVLARVAACEAALAGAAPPALPTAAAAPSTSGVHDAGVETEVTAVDPTGGETQQRLQRELLERGITRHRFVRGGWGGLGRWASGWVGAWACLLACLHRAPPHTPPSLARSQPHQSTMTARSSFGRGCWGLPAWRTCARQL